MGEIGNWYVTTKVHSDPLGKKRGYIDTSCIRWKSKSNIFLYYTLVWFSFRLVLVWFDLVSDWY